MQAGFGALQHAKPKHRQDFDVGATALKENPALLDARIAAGSGEDIAVLVYTSGTTGKPKGARISHRALLFQMTAVPDPFAARQGDELLTYLPLCHLAERIVCCASSCASALLSFAEFESVFLNIRELSPTILFAVPRIWEKFYSRIATLMDEATWIGRKGYAAAMRISRRRARLLMKGSPRRRWRRRSASPTSWSSATSSRSSGSTARASASRVPRRSASICSNGTSRSACR